MEQQQTDSLESLLKRIVRDASVSRLLSVSHLSAVQSSAVLDFTPVFAHRMAVIMVSGRNIRMTFKAQFSSESARFFAHQSYGLEESRVTIAQAEDFVREFCNVVAGYIKTIMASNQVTVGVSLPTLARGFDNFFFKEPTVSRVVKDQWKLNFESAEIYCFALIEILNDFSLNENSLTVDDSGEVEFL